MSYGVSDFNDAINTINRLQDYASSSLPQFTKPALIESPVFIDDAIAGEKVLDDLIRGIYNIYIGYILTALHLNQPVSDNRTIRDMTSVVSTHGYLNKSNEEYVGNESLSLELIGAHDDPKLVDDPKENPLNTLNSSGRKEMHQYEPPKNVSLPSGRIIELFFANPTTGKDFSLKVFMKLNPRFIQSSLVDYIVDANFRLPFMRRLLQLQAGEIKFFRDFVFQVDSVEKRAKALKNDRDNSLKDLFSHQTKSFFKRILKTFGMNHSQNIFNSILILEENNFMRIAHNKGLNFKDSNQRQKFFDATTSLFIVLVDPQYGLIKMYTNGIDQVGEYTFNAFKSATSGDKMSVAEIMQMMEQSKMPKF